jgi:1-acyl-sn-glycerol-3-phosphate acyltransferase
MKQSGFLHSVLYWLYQPYAWLVFAPIAILLTLLFSLFTIIASILINSSFAGSTFPVVWARLVARLTPMAVTVHGGEHADPQRSYVVVCNHQSQYDILLVYGWLKLNLKWVMKKELRKIPGLGLGCEKAGHIFVDRSNPRAARTAVMEALERLGNGVGILFFVEGTRSNDGRLLPFKKGAYRLAVEQQLPILPVTVSGTREIMPARTLRLFPGRGTLTIHPPIETAGLELSDMEQLIARSREVIASALPPELR